MAFELPPLPYATNALEPFISTETLHYHYDKHHRTYLNNLNMLTQGSELANHSLETIIRQATGPVFNNAAQVWNHTFYWHCLKQQGGNEPTGAIAQAIQQRFGNFSVFKEAFTDAALKNFGSGWTWLVKQRNGQLEIVNTANAGCPLTSDAQPLLTVDIWEHAYYIDYRNARADYLSAFWSLVNWYWVEKNLHA